MADAVAALPRGRHRLSREEVAQAQRLRLVVGMAEAMAERGYVGTSVAAVLRRAGVSRETFYELYADKLACFLDALDVVGEVLVAELAPAMATTAAVPDRPTDPVASAVRAMDRYLRTIAAEPAFARLFLVEVHAAGPEAMARRAALQDRLAAGLARSLGSRTAAQRFAVRAYVASVATLVAAPLAAGDLDAVAALRRPLQRHLRDLVERGLVA